MGVQELAVVGLVGSGVGAALSLPMVWPGRGRALDPRVLGGAMLLMSAIAALISARLAGFVATSPVVEHAINLAGLCAFPLAVVYTRVACGAPRREAWAPVLWLPAALYLGLTLLRRTLGWETGVPFVWLLPVALGFTAMSVHALWHRQAPVDAPIVPPEWVVGFQVVLNAAQVVRMDFGHVPAVRALVPLVLAVAFVAMVAFVTWRTMAAPASRANDVPAPGRRTRPAEPLPPARYERSSLDETAAAELLAHIDRALAEERLFARPDLSLAQLADAVRSTPHQVSEALNRFGGVTFHELLNRHRVADVKVQLQDPASDRYTIEGIGASAGFGSRSALYAAFQRAEGTTPTAFRAAVRSTPRA